MVKMVKNKKKKDGKRKLNVWYRCLRSVNGKKRWVDVLKYKDHGKIKEKVKVAYPKNNNIPINRKAKSLSGVAKGNYLNAKRNEIAKSLDKKKTSKDTRAPTNKNIETWRKNAGRMDLKGVDTKK